MITAYRVTYNSDTVEGRGASVTKGYATTRAVAAVLAAKCPKIMGVSDSSAIEEVTILESIEEFETLCQNNLYKSAVAKLSDAELAALSVVLRRRP